MSALNNPAHRPRLSLGPILYLWPREQVFDFYAEMLETPVDVVYLGETICSKRRQLKPEDYWELAERVTAAGKQAVISTLALIALAGCGSSDSDYPDGLLVTTQEGQEFLSLNGIQTQSASTHNLLPAIDEVRALGVDLLRISPQSRHTADVIRTFADCLTGDLDPTEGTARLSGWAPSGLCDGYWTGESGYKVGIPGQNP